MKKIKVVYEWIGPRGPMSNNKTPDIFQFSSKMWSVTVEAKHVAHTPYIWDNVFRFFPELFEIVPAFALKEDDFFIYDYQLHHRVPFESFFTFNAESGLLESIIPSSNVIQQIRKKNGYLFLDMALESFVSDRIFYLMHNYFSLHNLPLNKIIYQTSCPNVDILYNKYCDSVGIPEDSRMKMMFWGSFEWEMSKRHKDDTYHTKRHIEILEKDFLCLNYRYRPHRIDLLCLFHKLGLLEKTFFTMPSHNPDNPISTNSFSDSINPNFCNRIGITVNELNKLQNILPLQVDELSSSVNNHSQMTMGIRGDLNIFYDKSLISIVTETTAYQDAVAQTEKTFKPILQKQPFIIVGAPYSLEYLRKRGYKTFSNWFSEDYDKILNHEDRVITISNLCKEISNWDLNKKKTFIEETQDTVEYNYNVFQNVHGKQIPQLWYDLYDKANGDDV